MGYQEEEIFYFIQKLIEIIEKNVNNQIFIEFNPKTILVSSDNKVNILNNLMEDKKPSDN